MGSAPEEKTPPTVIGGRHGSPSVTIAWPFSKVMVNDTDVRAAVADLARIVAELSEADAATRAMLRQRATEIAKELEGG